ncbi:unnamed protein product [Heterobilharzia americana]|nr:unnamed protein product [Heterobilharzia americana]
MANIKSQTYCTKLKALNEACSKLVNNSSNLPSSNDITSLLKFFQNILYNILKDIQVLSVERFMSRINDQEWRATYLPQLDYGTLYLCALTISEHIQKLTNQSTVCEHLLRTIQSLIFCLDYDCLEGVPLAITWMLLYFPSNMYSGVIELLCSVAIPLIYHKTDDQESYAIDCIPSILTLVFQHVEKIEYHVWVLESFMSRKKDLYKDLLMIIAYGPTEARLPAVCLFFHYWPENYPTAFYGNQVLQPIHYAWESWKPITCYRICIHVVKYSKMTTDRCEIFQLTFKVVCLITKSQTTVKMTVNPKISIQQSGKPPPLYVCLDCADALNRLDFDQLVDILLPTKQISLTCESKTCRSKNNSASITCWSTGCTYLTGNRAIRLCELCHTMRHIYSDATIDTTSGVITNTNNENDNRNTDQSTTHIYQSSLPDVWDMSLDSQPCMIQSIISLTLETMPRWRQVLLGGIENGDESTNRAVVGLTCPGSSAPGGPASSNEMVMLGLSGGPIITSNLSGNSMNNTSNLPIVGSSIGQTSFSDFGTAQITGSTSRNPTGPGITGAGTIGGIAGVNDYAHNAGTETGAITLLGRYTDEDHKVLAVYGAFLVGEKCRPRERINLELLTRITAGIFNWFLDTIYTAEASITFDGRGNLRQRYELGDLLERIKSEYILKWIQEVQRLYPEAIFAVLLPHPLKYARVGSCWDAISDHLSRVKHGLSRIGSLIPYDIITFETWDFVMPYWLESIRTEVPRVDYPELEILLKKIFDATAGPFPFLPQKVYHFASERFVNTPVSVQDQALSWLEVLTTVEVPIPMKELLTMFAAEYDDDDDNDAVDEDLTYQDSDENSFDQNTVSETDWLTEHGISSEKMLNDNDNEDADEDDDGGAGVEDHLKNEDESDVFLEESSHSRVVEEEYVDRNPDPIDNQFVLNENDYTEVDEDLTLDETKSLLSSSMEGKTNPKSFSSSYPRKTNKQSRIPFTVESSDRHTKSIIHDPSSKSNDHITDHKIDEDKLNQHNLIDENEGKQMPKSDIPVIHDPVEQQTKKHGSHITPYRMTACLTHMLDIAYRQLKIMDPIGHSGFTQETPNLLLWLLGDMLELYWGNVVETDDETMSPGLRNLRCKGLETCILPKTKSKFTNDSKPSTGITSAKPTAVNNNNDNNLTEVNKQTDNSADECIDCLDMLTWFNYARLICQHLAPIRPTPKVTIEFTIDALTAATNFPEYTEWSDFNCTPSLNTKSPTPTLDQVEKCSSLPSSEDLCSVPPVLRLVYLLTRFLKEGSRCCVDYEDLADESDNLFQSMMSTSVKTSSATISAEQPTSSQFSSSMNQANIELKVFRDPVVLQCILECLAYLCHIGDALRHILTKAEREEQKLSATTSSSSTSTTLSSMTTTVAAGAINIGVASNMPISTTTGAQTTLGVNSLMGLTGNKLSSQLTNQDLLSKGQLIQTTKTLTSRNCTASPRAQKDFVYYLIHSHLIPSFWSLLKSELSHLASWTVPLILHCLSFPGGFNILWKLIERDFSHHDWRIRFNAIEKVSVLFRELDYYVLAGGFSGSAGNKLTHLLSGGSMASSGAVNLFCRLTGATHIGRTKLNTGRKNLPGGHLMRQHGGTSVEPVSKTNPNTSNNRHPLIQSAIAHAFCCLIGSLDDPNSMIAQYTSIQLASLHSISLACAIQCLEFQFDTVIADRCLILQRMHQLSCNLPNRQIFTWDFFVNRFGLLTIQAQLGNTPNQIDIDTVTDLNGSHRTGEHFQNQFERAAFAINKSSGLKSISLNSHAYSLRFSSHTVGSFTQAQQSQTQLNIQQQMITSNTTTCNQSQMESHIQRKSISEIGSSDLHNTDSVVSDGVHRSQFKFGHGARRSRPSISSVCGLLTGGSQAGEFVDSNNKFLSSIQQALDLDGNERDTLHQWVRLLLKFMSTVQLDIKMDEYGTSGPNSGGGCSSDGVGGVGGGSSSGIGSSSGSSGRHNMANKSRDELKDRKALSKAQRHLAFLLGYTDGSFDIPPHKMRNSTVFHAFLAHVAGVLDRNFSMGCCILHQTLVVLQFCASPQRYATDTQPPTFTLRLLEPQVRLHWLQTLLVILYSLLGVSGGVANLLSSSSSTNISGGTRGMIEYLIQIVLNTLDSHVHVCRDRPNEDLVAPFSSQLRIREASNVSTDFNTILETETPPATPIKEEHHDDEDTVVMPGVTINLLSSPTEVNENSHSKLNNPIRSDSKTLDIDQRNLDESSYEINNMTRKRNEGQLDINEQTRNNDDDDDDDNIDNKSIQSRIIQSDEQKRKSFDFNIVNNSIQKNFRYKQMITSKSTSYINKQQYHQGQHLSNISFISLKDERNEIKQINPTIDPCTVTQDEQSIVTPLLTDSSETNVIQERKEVNETSTNESQIKGGSNECKSPKKVTLKFPKRGSASTIQEEKKLKPLRTDLCNHSQSTQLTDSVQLINKSKRFNNQSTKYSISHPLDTFNEDGISHHKFHSNDSSCSNTLTVNRSQSVAEDLYLSNGIKLDKKYESIKKNSYIPVSSSTVTHNTISTNIHNHIQNTNINIMPNLTSAAITFALTTERCPWCQCILEHYDENTLGLGILCLSTFVHREPSLAAPYLRDMLLTTARLASTYFYSWQPELSHIISPGNVASIARQFLRCTMYNLAPNGLFTQLFQTHIPDDCFFKTIISVLVDFEDHMSFFQPINLLLESLNKQKSINLDTLPILLEILLII